MCMDKVDEKAPEYIKVAESLKYVTLHRKTT